jgi:two-component system, LuxR family, sensor kinase FixL
MGDRHVECVPRVPSYKMRNIWRHDLLRVLITAALCYASGEIGVRLLSTPTSPSPVFLPAGVLLGAAIRWGYRIWPGIMLGTLLLALSFEYALDAMVMMLITCTAIPLVVRWILENLLGFRFQLESYRDVLILLTGSLIAGGLSALINVPLLTWVQVQTMEWDRLWGNIGIWWLGDATGALLVAPLFLVLKKEPGVPLFPLPRTELILAMGTLVLVCGINFNGWLGRNFHNHLFILTPYPVLLWIGLRLNRAAAMIASLILATMSIHGTVQGFGPFVHEGTIQSLIALAAFLATSTLSLLLLSLALSERRHVETRLAQQSNVMESTLKHLPGAVYWTNQAAVYQGCNLEFAELAGVTEPAELIGKTWRDLPKKNLLKHFDGELDEEILYSGQARLDVEIEIDEPAGGRRTLLTNKIPLRNSSGAVIGMVGTAVDVTRLKQADRLVHESLHRLRRIVDHLPAGALFVEGERLHFNKIVEEFTGYSQDELATRDLWFELLFPHDPESRRQNYEASRALGFPYPREVLITRRDGTQRWLSISSYQDKEGEIWLLYDITQRHKTEEALRERERELAHVTRLCSLGEMVAEIAHEINQPLYAISNFSAACLTTLESKPADGPEMLKDWLGKIHGQAEQAATIIRRLRQMAAPSAQQARELNLVSVLDDVLEMLAMDSRKAGIQTRTEFPPDIPNVVGDPVQIQQILINLIKNAYEALTEVEEPRHVTIQLVPRDKEVEIVIADNGPGFSAESARRMFDAFYTTKSRGMGMGLPICRSLITAHGGELWIEQAPIRGAEIHFTLPIDQDESAET